MKKSTLDLLREIVIFTVSSLNANSSGDGSISATTSTFPIGSFVYLIFALINLFTFTPIASSKDSNDFVAVSKSHCNDVFAHEAILANIWRLSHIIVCIMT